MTAHNLRLPSGGDIDREDVIRFTFNGKSYEGYAGDTLASALLANGVHLTARSFRYKRPRGVFSAGSEEHNALVSVGEPRNVEPNVRASTQVLYDGLIANSQGGWPSVGLDLGALTGWASRFLPTGFYYKTFKWPGWHWYGRWIRRLANSAPVSVTGDDRRSDKRTLHCDLLVVGAGPAGIAAATAAAKSGSRIILVDEKPVVGGSLLTRPATVNGVDGEQWARSSGKHLESLPNVTLLPNCTAVAAWDHGYFTAVQTFPVTGQSAVHERLLKIRCRRTILATGAIERPMVFPDNDRPGIMQAGAALAYVHRFAVLPGHAAVVYTNNNSAWCTAFDLQAAGVNVAAIVDVRSTLDDAILAGARELGIEVHAGSEIVATSGYLRLRRVAVRATHPANSASIRIDCDLLCVSGGWDPAVHLLSQAGGKLEFDSTLACFVPDAERPHDIISSCGAAAGTFALAELLPCAHEKGARVASAVSDSGVTAGSPPCAPESRYPYAIEAHWQSAQKPPGRQWVDHAHDVTVDSINTAALEGFTSVEHLKRYTTTGMSVDQGKLANVNALAILGEATDRAPDDVGTTRFRPPFVPVRLGTLAGRETGARAWPMRRLPLHDWHVANAAHMEDHSGWWRAAFYTRGDESETDAIRRETLAARTGVALFDSSSLGKIEVRGPDAAEFLNRVYINNVATLAVGKARYGIMLHENGIVMDDGVFARLEDNLFVVSASSAGTVDVLLGFEEWLQTEWPGLDVIIHNATCQWATITITGPESRKLLSSLLPDMDLGADTLPHMAVCQGHRGGMPFRLMRVSFTGELSFELNVPADDASQAWEQLMDAGKELDATPLGMEALDVLRIEKGFAEVGVDTDGSTSPVDLGWGRAIGNKAADFVGKRSLQLANFVHDDRMQLVGIRPVNENILLPAGAQLVVSGERDPEGYVTSSCLSPTLGRCVAMAMLRSGSQRMDDEVTVDVDGTLHTARIVPLCAYDPDGQRLKS